MTGYLTSAWRRAGLVLAGLLLSGAAALAQNIGIGTNAPTEALDVNGNLRLRGLSNNSERGRLLSVLPDGTLTAGEKLGALSGLGASSRLLPTPVLSPVPLGNNSSFADVTTDGRYLYLLGNQEVHVYNVAAPIQPTLAAAPTAVIPKRGKRLAVGNGYAYVVNFSDTLDVYQLTTPTTFAFRRTIINRPPGATSTSFIDMVVSGNYLYYVGNFPGLGSAGQTAKLLTYDLTNPANPVLLNVLDVPNSRGNSRLMQLAVDESTSTLYVHIGGFPYALFQLAAPGTPTALRTTGTASPRELQNMAVLGGTLYQINVDGLRLHVLDVSANPASPQELSTIPLPARVSDINIVGRYAYLSGSSPNGFQLYALQVAAPSVLTFDTNGGISTQSALVPANNDNLGSHTATQNLNLGAFQLVGNGGGSGLSISSSGQVGIGTATPSAALDVNGAARATTLTTTGAVQAATVVASTSVQTPAVYTAATGSHNMLVQAYGSIGGGGNAFGSTGNYTVTHAPNSNTYRIVFSSASGLSTTVLTAAVVNLTVYGTTPGFANFTTNTAGTIEVTTTNANGQPAERGFSFSVYLP